MNGARCIASVAAHTAGRHPQDVSTKLNRGEGAARAPPETTSVHNARDGPCSTSERGEYHCSTTARVSRKNDSWLGHCFATATRPLRPAPRRSSSQPASQRPRPRINERRARANDASMVHPCSATYRVSAFGKEIDVGRRAAAGPCGVAVAVNARQTAGVHADRSDTGRRNPALAASAAGAVAKKEVLQSRPPSVPLTPRPPGHVTASVPLPYSFTQ
ncbi:hypothetical protein EVAR_5390_1 [Eumeta japonica]|uniref:Uncharacterized protein n=1 Tax=Eumeta variegata TaxID=151549 RepID=A0A4C1TAJ0_EUMVA|nr:hypothetical protein EVAR_5390_1 [Eumeta japonica]